MFFDINETYDKENYCTVKKNTVIFPAPKVWKWMQAANEIKTRFLVACATKPITTQISPHLSYITALLKKAACKSYRNSIGSRINCSELINFILSTYSIYLHIIIYVLNYGHIFLTCEIIMCIIVYIFVLYRRLYRMKWNAIRMDFIFRIRIIKYAKK